MVIRMKVLKINRTFRNLIPPLTSEEYVELEDDIVKNGCRDAIEVWRGHETVVDGHNRYDICTKHKVGFDITEMDFVDEKAVIGYILTKQLARRNINAAQRIKLAAKREKLKNASKHVSVSDTNLNTDFEVTRETRKKIAEETGVSETTVGNTLKVLKDGDEKTKEDMLSGKESINKSRSVVKDAEKGDKTIKKNKKRSKSEQNDEKQPNSSKIPQLSPLLDGSKHLIGKTSGMPSIMLPLGDFKDKVGYYAIVSVTDEKEEESEKPVVDENACPMCGATVWVEDDKKCKGCGFRKD